MNIQAVQPIKAEGATEASFAMTLRQLMIDKRISASDLARAVWGTTKDGRGYEVAKNRDRVGHYLSGNSHPSRENLVKIAKALSVKVDVLEKVQPSPIVRKAESTKDIDIVFFTEGPNKGAAALSAAKVLLSLKTVMEIIDLVGKDPLHSKRTLVEAKDVSQKSKAKKSK